MADKVNYPTYQVRGRVPEKPSKKEIAKKSNKKADSK